MREHDRADAKPVVDVPFSRSWRDQAGVMAVALHNLAINCMPTFRLKRMYLRLSGHTVGEPSYIHPPVRFLGRQPLHLGKNSSISYGCIIDPRGGLEIGESVMIGHYCSIYTAGHDVDFRLAGTFGTVRIGNHAVLFPHVIVMPGVTIGRGGVVYPGSVVTRDVEEMQIVGGNPARPIRKREDSLDYRLNVKWWWNNS